MKYKWKFITKRTHERPLNLLCLFWGREYLRILRSIKGSPNDFQCCDYGDFHRRGTGLGFRNDKIKVSLRMEWQYCLFITSITLSLNNQFNKLVINNLLIKHSLETPVPLLVLFRGREYLVLCKISTLKNIYLCVDMYT